MDVDPTVRPANVMMVLMTDRLDGHHMQLSGLPPTDFTAGSRAAKPPRSHHLQSQTNISVLSLTFITSNTRYMSCLMQVTFKLMQ